MLFLCFKQATDIFFNWEKKIVLNTKFLTLTLNICDVIKKLIAHYIIARMPV